MTLLALNLTATAACLQADLLRLCNEYQKHKGEDSVLVNEKTKD